MVASCCAIDCTNRVGSSSCGRKITFHRFPAEKLRRSAWVKAVNRIDPSKRKIWNPSRTAVLCSEHFKMDDFLFYRGATVLKKDAVPSKFSFSQCKVSIEGNIGSGKSSLLGFFCQFPYVEAVEEPIKQWTHIGGKHNALKLLYEDPARWSFAFNHYSTLTRLQIQAKPSQSPVKMIERSLFSTRNTFVENAYKVRWLTDLEYLILNEYFDYIESSVKDAKIDLFVYLRVSPEICLERIRKRSRAEESPISMDYIKTLHTLHEELFVQKNRKLTAPVLVLDGNADLSDMYKIYDKNKLTILGGYT